MVVMIMMPIATVMMVMVPIVMIAVVPIIMVMMTMPVIIMPTAVMMVMMPLAQRHAGGRPQRTAHNRAIAAANSTTHNHAGTAAKGAANNLIAIRASNAARQQQRNKYDDELHGLLLNLSVTTGWCRKIPYTQARILRKS